MKKALGNLGNKLNSLAIKVMYQTKERKESGNELVLVIGIIIIGLFLIALVKPLFADIISGMLEKIDTTMDGLFDPIP